MPGHERKSANKVYTESAGSFVDILTCIFRFLSFSTLVLTIAYKLLPWIFSFVFPNNIEALLHKSIVSKSTSHYMVGMMLSFSLDKIIGKALL